MADPFLEAIGVKEPQAKPAAKPASAPKARSYTPEEAAIRMAYAEETDPQARKWVAGVIANRAKKSKRDFLKVISEAGQFEPWTDPDGRKRFDSLDVTSDEYKALEKDLLPILKGEAPDPSGGAMNFYGPESQKAKGRNPPDFDDGKGVAVGKSLFFGGKSLPVDPFLASLNVDPKVAEEQGIAAERARFTATGVMPYRGLSEKLPPNQQEVFASLKKGGGYKPTNPDGSDAPGGTPTNPYFMQAGTKEEDVPPGAYYVNRKDKTIHRAPTGKDVESAPGRGFVRGLGDVGLSTFSLLPGSEDSTILNRMRTNQYVYDADLKGDFVSGMGRFGGQVAGASLPIMAGGAAATPVLARSAAGRFLLGTAGSGEAAAGFGGRTAQLLTRGGSLATSGAFEGAAAGALTHSANDAPLEEQMATGAIFGGVLKPLGAGVETGMRRFFGPSTAGSVPASAQQELSDAARSLPVPVALDAGQITRAPAASAAVDDILRGADGDLAAGVVQRFRGEQQAALRANVTAISDSIAGKPTAPGEGARAVSDTLNARRDAMKKGVDKAYDEARARGEDAMLATAKDVREGIVDGLKRKFNQSKIGSVLGEVESLGAEGAPTVRQLYEARERLVGLTGSSDNVEAAAARAAKDGLDTYIKTALKNDLFVGDPKAIGAWRDAIKKRSELGKLFEGDDLIEGLTERTQRGGGMTLKRDAEEAVNYILGVSDLGFATKRDLTRDLFRLRDVLGPKSEEWNGMRAEVFMRLARAGEGVPEAGATQFSGQKFLKAWNELNTKNPRMVRGMFTSEERDLITKFADVAQAATTTVKGGANVSNSAIAGKRMMDKFAQLLSVGGGGAGGAAVGGIPGAAMGALFGSFLKDVRELLAVRKARKLTTGAAPVNPGPQNKLLGPPVVAATIGGNRLISEHSEP